MLWFSGLAFLVFYSLMQPELLLNHKIWAKLTIVMVLSVNGFYLHKFVIPLIVNSQGKILIRVLSLRQLNSLTLIGCISFISWPLVMFLGTFKSINFSFSFLEIIGFYLSALILALVTAFTLKSLLIEKEMNRKIRVLNEHLQVSKQKLAAQTLEIKVLSNVIKQS